MADDTEDMRDDRGMPEESEQRLRREFAKCALTGIMPWAMQHNKSEFEVSNFAWKVADAMIELEHGGYEEPAPPPPQPRSAARPGPQRVANPAQRRPR